MQPRQPESQVLRREVMTPHRRSAGAGLLAMSTLAMIFSIGGSLMMMTANHRFARHNHDFYSSTASPWPEQEHYVPVDVVRTVEMPISAADAAACRAPVYHSMADGRTEIQFAKCLPR